MKIQFGSDLHCEFDGLNLQHKLRKNPVFPFTKTDADVLILAGDINIGDKADFQIKSYLERYKYVMYIPGNHEYYHNDFDKVNSFWSKFEKTINDYYKDNTFDEHERFSFMLNKSKIIDGIKFIGATLWTDFDNHNPVHMNAVQRYMNDYRIITYKNNKLHTEDTYNFHLESRKFIEEELNTDLKKVVFTHMAPSKQSTHPRYKNDEYVNSGYSSNLDELVDKTNIWIHGHTHDCFDYTIGNGRVISNPRGYFQYDENPKFNPALVIEV